MFPGRVEVSSTPRSHDCCSFSRQCLSEQVAAAAANPGSIDLQRPSRCAGSLKRRTKKYLGLGARSQNPGCCCSGSLLRVIRADGSRSEEHGCTQLRC